MVNAKFPERTRYGFEMVDGLCRSLAIAMAASIENLRRIESFGFFYKFSAILVQCRHLRFIGAV